MDNTRRVLTWTADPAAGEQRFEQAHVRGDVAGFRARGTILVGAGELTDRDGPFRVDYELDTVADWATRRVVVRAEGAGWRREVWLRRDGAGAWTCRRVAAPGDPRPEVPDPAVLTGAVDCDLVSSALFNMMPIARSGLHRRPGRQDFLMAWVSIPDLRVTPSRQTYGHVRPGVVSFASDGFTADLEVDGDGYAVRYPQVALRVPDAVRTGPPAPR